MKQVLKPSNLLRIDKLFRIANEAVQTNVPLGVTVRYLPMVRSLQGDKITSYTVEGEDATINGTYYYEPDMAKLNELVDTYFYSQSDFSANQQTRVGISVANGSRASAEQIAKLLKKHGFQVIDISIAEDSELLVSQVISTKRKSQSAVAVAEVLSIQEVLLDTQSDATADVIVIVGKDMLP